jgi:pimeloyl-ACP methyl ester carboxylesterase
MVAVPSDVSEELVTLSTGVSLRVLSRGSGRPIVFVPGWTCTADFFTHQFAGLGDEYRVISYDPRGHGGSDKPLEGNNFRQRGADLAALIDALKLAKPVLLGWSFGAYDVLSYVRDSGVEKIGGVIICDETPKCPADPTDSTEWGEAPLTPDGMPALLRMVIDDRLGFWTWYAKYMIGLPEDTADDHPDVARIVELGMQAPEHVGIATIADGVSTDLSEAAAKAAASIPTMLMARHDWADDAKAWVKKNMPGADFETIDHHMGFVTNPTGFNQSIRSFVEKS